MLAMLMFTAILAGQGASVGHVRTTEPEIAALIAAGFAQSPTFRRLVETLDRSDVIVYVRPKMKRPHLNGYLEHGVVASGRYRYLRIAIDVHGGHARLVSLLAHELQHALEVAADPNARDYETVEQLFGRLREARFCGLGSCYETEAAQKVEQAVIDEVLSPRVIPASN